MSQNAGCLVMCIRTLVGIERKVKTEWNSAKSKIKYLTISHWIIKTGTHSW